MSDLWSARLSEYLDGDLSPGETRDLGLHLGECAACAHELEGLRRVRAKLAALPGSEPPERVWRGIRARLDPGRAGRAWRWGWVVGYGTAGVALVAGAALWVSLRQGGAAPERIAREGPAAPGTAGQEAADAYGAAAESWRQALLAGSPEPEMTDLIAANLRPFDRAIEETRQALARDPGDSLLRDHLSRLLRAQMRFLRRAGASTQGSVREAEG